MHVLTRRHFLATAAFGAAGAASFFAMSSRADERSAKIARWATEQRPLVISTWKFGKPANEKAVQVIQAGGSALDGVERGINVTEADPTMDSVGLSGKPNAAGVVQLDACIMDGPTHKAGSVASLEGIAHPISVARRVMEKTKHVMLVGPGAREFAVKEGFPIVPKKESGGGAPAAPSSEPEHDTIALIALAPDLTLAGGCSTSGLGGKLPGRVGDSPLIGGGLYVDGDIGGAGATGTGENILRFAGSFQVVEFMRQGLHPAEACVATVRRILSKHPAGMNPHVNFVALNKKGEYGAAGTDDDFQFSIAWPGFSQIVAPIVL